MPNETEVRTDAKFDPEKRRHLDAITKILEAGLILGLDEHVARAWSEGCFMSARVLARELGRDHVWPNECR